MQSLSVRPITILSASIQIRKLAPDLRVFNAKPVERWTRSKKTLDRDTSQTDSMKQKKRKNTETHVKEDPEIAKKKTKKVKESAAVSPREEKREKEKKKEEKKEKKVTKKKVGNSVQEFDDGESSFMDLVVSHQKDSGEKDLPAKKVQFDTKLLGGRVIDHKKKKKKSMKQKRDKSVAVVHSAALPAIPEVGVGGPSTWKD